MKRYYLIVLTVAIFVIATGTAFAGESMAQLRLDSDDWHGYALFASYEDRLIQIMVNGDSADDVSDRVVNMIEKYMAKEGGVVVSLMCGTADTLCTSVNLGDGSLDTQFSCIGNQSQSVFTMIETVVLQVGRYAINP